MKIKDMINILGLDKEENIPFIPMRPGSQLAGKLTIYSTPQGIHYWDGADISFISEDENCLKEVYKIKRILNSQVAEVSDNDQREFNKYLAIAELLIAIDEYRGGEGNIDIQKAKEYVNALNKHIEDSLDFNDIIEMKELIEYIKTDKLYKELCFTVDEICCKRDDRFRKFAKNENKYCFGNKEYHEKLDIVHITTYNNYIELQYELTGARCEKDLGNDNQDRLEEKIFCVLGCWRNKYTN